MTLLLVHCTSREKKEVQPPVLQSMPVWTDNLLQEIQSTGQDSIDTDIFKYTCDLPLTILKTPRLYSIASIRDENLSRSWAQRMIAPVQMCENYSDYLAVADEMDTLSKRAFFEETITLASNPKELLPLKNEHLSDIQIVHLGKESRKVFDKRFSSYTSNFKSRYAPHLELFDSEPFEKKKLVIVTLATAIDYRSLYEELNVLNQKTNLLIVNFENLTNLKNLSKQFTVLQVYEHNEITEDFCAQMVFGAIQAKGQLPIPVSNEFKYGQGILNTPLTRIKYGLPEEGDINSEKLYKYIDPIVERAIRKEATPGARVLIAKSGKIIFNKAYGYHTYDKIRRVQNDDLYDIASITKVAATTLALMRLYEEGKIDTFEDYLENYLGTETAKGDVSRIHNVRLRYLLTHRSGLPVSPPIIPYVRIKDTTSTAFKLYFAEKQLGDYSVKITNRMFLKKGLQDKLWYEIQRTRLGKRRSFEYSDVNFLVLQKLVEELTQQPLDEYVYNEFYKPLSLSTLTFNPLDKFSKDRIVPTEYDKKWRRQQLQGLVQDEAAAFFGGVGGNAGLFSTAEDLAVLGQMLLNGGTFGDTRLFEEETVDYFTSTDHGNHRGLGFDVKTRKGAAGCYYGAGKGTFGHSGFTGTCLWVDPKNELVYVFLSNRVFPDEDNEKLMKLKTREMVHRAIYKSMM